MSALSILEGLHERLATVEGLAALYDYEPTSTPALPAVYSLLDAIPTIEMTGQLLAYRYRFLHRLCVAWLDNERAERELLLLLDRCISAIHADRRLGGRLALGIAQVVEVQTGFVTIGNTLYRVADIYSVTLEK